MERKSLRMRVVRNRAAELMLVAPIQLRINELKKGRVLLNLANSSSSSKKRNETLICKAQQVYGVLGCSAASALQLNNIPVC